mmetsp:Transcript_11223/g.25454  ORF Transcript_11223/g.25454 Transcript_11223/m.25454 type:complete len:114 (-) Transcript_11223:1920-2261(-)
MPVGMLVSTQPCLHACGEVPRLTACPILEASGAQGPTRADLEVKSVTELEGFIDHVLFRSLNISRARSRVSGLVGRTFLLVVLGLFLRLTGHLLGALGLLLLRLLFLFFVVDL